MLSKRSQPGRSVYMKFKNQVNLVYEGRTQQKGGAADDDQEGHRRAPWAGRGMRVCGNAPSLILGTYTHAHAGIKFHIERRLHLIVCELNLTERDRLPQVGAGF